MRTKSVTVYKFNELSAAAKERAREWYREGAFSHNWWDYIYEDAAGISEILGIALMQRAYSTVGGATRYEPCIYFSGFWSQGDGARFEGIYQPALDASKKIREYAPQDEKLHRIADGLVALALPEDFSCSIGHRGSYEHKYTMTFEYDSSAEIDHTEPFEDLMRDFAQWIYDALKDEYDYQNSDEQIDEAIVANEYEFTEEGKRCVLI